MTLHTKEDVEKRWRPFTRVGEPASGAAENRPDGSYNCIASECMAWRWAYTEKHTDIITGKVDAGVRLKSGYCGLAGSAE